ncbi:MuDRA-like transposase [Cucumis melo var. makuwa]|uniref:MuDRA-like transposase n=1 Tax=Cucumis melo var. makuwa TaxID=1194695 RepID=A0A5D3BKY5_CUCMM|nr:MuDRA-like transposase [Cucumis melo var. makuwa]
MTHVRILVRYGGAWDEGRRKYEGGVLKGIVVSKEITHKDLQDELYDLAKVDPRKFDIKIRCIYEIGEKEAPPFELSNDRDLKFYILSENPLEVPLYLSFEPTSNRRKKVLNKDYNSVSGSNQVQNLNPHPPIGMDTLHDNEVDIGEVQVGLCDNMIRTNSAIWESYESYHSKDDPFTWESVEMNNELFDIQNKEMLLQKIAKEKSKFKGASRLYKPRDIIEDMRQDYDINMSYEKAWRARENAYERVRGSLEESYNLLHRYGEALKFTNPGKYLNDVGIARWSRVHCPGRRYNMMTTNIAESMNSILKEHRDLPIASFLGHDRALLQRWFWKRREESIKVTSTLTKWAELVIQKKQERALTMKVNPIDYYQFHVKDLDKKEVVNLQTKECTCKEFQAKPSTQLGISQIGRQAKTTYIPEDGNADGICCSVLGKNVRFTQKKFNIITELWPTNRTLEKDCDNKRLQSLLFGLENKKLITCLEIEEIFKNFEFTNDDDAVKVALAVFIETVMVGKDKKTQFDMDILGRVDDEEAFKSFDWSTFFYTRLLNSLNLSLQGKKEAYELKKPTSSKAVAYYNIKGYVLAFQVWAYEVL